MKEFRLVDYFVIYFGTKHTFKNGHIKRKEYLNPLKDTRSTETSMNDIRGSGTNVVIVEVLSALGRTKKV